MGIFTKRLSASVFAALLLATSASAGVKFNAVVSWPDNNAGVYTFDTESYGPQLVKLGVNANGGGFVYKDGKYYTTQYVELMGIVGVKQITYNMSTWEVDDEFTGSVSNIATATASNRDLGLYVGCYYNPDGETFRFCSIKTYYQTKIADLEKPWAACAFDKNGILYAIEEDGKLYTVDPFDGKMTYVGDTGVASEWNTGAIVDPETNAFIYATKTDDAAALYSIDLDTATATKLYDLENGEQLCGFFLDEKEYASDAPAAASSNPSMSIYSDNLTQNLSVYFPRYTVGGTLLTGQEVTYHIYANGKEILTGTETVSAYSSSKRMSVTVDEPGTYCFSVDFSNEAGHGPRSYSDTYYLGPDMPKAPTTCSPRSYTDGKVSVSWSAVSSTGLHNGYVDRTNATYVLTRYPEGKVVTPEGHKTTTFVDSIGTPDVRTEFYYTVKVVMADGAESPTTQSTKFTLGPITPPYETSFSVQTDFWGFSSYNPGTDTKKWEWDSDKVIRVSTNAKPADNYLILPKLNLKPGESYPVAIEAAAYSSYYTTETMEVLAGSEPTVEGLTQTVIENTSVQGSNNDSQYVTYEGTLTAPEEGPCYLAIHATTPENGGYLYIKSIKIGKGMGERAPGAVTDFTATAAADGSHSVELAFKLPAVDLGGDVLDELTQAVILRDTDTIATMTADLTPGAEMTYTDDAEELTWGKHVYTVVCSNAHGEGTEAKAETFVGFSAPKAVESVVTTESTEGHVVATWEAVTADVDGRTLSADDVTYNVYKYLSGSKYPVAEGVKGTTAEYDAFDGLDHDGSQRFVQTLVEAVTEGGVSKVVPSLMTPVGTPDIAPWTESFADCKVSHIFANNIIKGDDNWRVVSEDDFGNKPADNDGGMLALEAYGRGACAVMTGKIDLGDVLQPAVTLQVYNFGSGATNDNVLEVGVRVLGDADFTKVFSTKVGEVGPKGEWSKVTVPLDDYAGMTVQLSFSAYNNEYSWTHIDDIRVTSNAPHNLAVVSVKAPLTVAPATDFEIAAEIENIGTEAARSFKVNLLCDEELVDTKDCSTLEPDTKTTVTFTRQFSIFEVGTKAFTVEIDYDLDMLESDNSKDFEVIVRSNTLPTVTDLAAEPHTDGAKLTWSAPSAQVKVASTETFDAPSLSWATKIEGWTFLDLDRGTIGGIGKKQLPVSGQQSFFVLDNTLAALQDGNVSAFAAHSGHQYLCSMYSAKNGQFVQSDDWAITPELSGEPQIITLYASSFPSDPGQPQYLETFQLLYSTTDTKPESFTLIEEYVKIPAAWRQYSAYVPEGAKYFAIRCVSYNQYMLFVDDVTFIAKNAATETVTPTGYNVYRDGLKLNEDPVATPTYLDETIDRKSTYKYHVSALYAAGESLPSNEVEYDSTRSGVDAVGYGVVTITATDGVITVAGAEGETITVVAADGKVIATEPGEAVNRFNVAAGIYIVKAADTVAKVSVR